MAKRFSIIGYAVVIIAVISFCLWLIFGVDHKSAEAELADKYLTKASYSFTEGEYTCIGVGQDVNGNRTEYLFKDEHGNQLSMENTDELYEVGSVYALTLGSADFSNTSLFYSSDSVPVFTVLTTGNALEAVNLVAMSGIKDSIWFEHFFTLFALGGLSVIIGLVLIAAVYLLAQYVHVRDLKLKGIDVS